MASSVSLGDWVQGSERFLDANLAKATSGGSAIPRGKVCGVTNGVWAVAGTTYSGKCAVCTHTNSDSDAAFTGLKGGGIAYVKLQGTCKAGDTLVFSTSNAGEVMKGVRPTISGTYTQAEVQAVEKYNQSIVGTYKGHVDEGDGSQDHPITDGANGDTIKIELSRQM